MSYFVVNIFIKSHAMLAKLISCPTLAVPDLNVTNADSSVGLRVCHCWLSLLDVSLLSLSAPIRSLRVSDGFSHCQVRAVPLYGTEVSRGPSPTSESPPPPAVDYFAYERTGGRTSPSPPAAGTPAPQSAGQSPPQGQEPAAPPADSREVAYAYVCTVPDWPGRLSLEKCVSLGVKPGPLLGRLKAGHNVVLEDGTIVRSADVTSPDEIGPQFVVLELPSASFLPSLSELDSSIDMSRLAAVVHFSPPAVLDDPMFRSWRGGLPAGVRHVVLNEAGRGHGSEAVHRLQHQLNTIDADLFPLLEGDDIDVSRELGNGTAVNGDDEKGEY